MNTDINNIQDTNYENSEFVYSWDKNDSMIMPKLIQCINCGSDVDPECDDDGCKTCGYSVKKYGFPKYTYDSDKFVEDKGVKIERFSPGAPVAVSFVSNWLCWALIAFFVARMRGELEYGIPVIICIAVFPQFYLTFALVDWLVFKYASKKQT